MPTIREMALRARELEEKVLVLNWIDQQLRILHSKDLQINGQTVSPESVAAVLADICERRELYENEMKRIWDLPIGVEEGGGEKVGSDDIPSL